MRHTPHRIALFLLSFAVAGAACAYPEYRVTIVGPPGSSAADINQAGAVVGSYPVGGSTHGFINRGNGLVRLGALGTSSGAVAVNDKGEVLGNWVGAGGQLRGFIYSCGRQRDIGVIGSGSVYSDINNAGYTIATSYTDSDPSGYLRAPNGRLTAIGHLPVEHPITQVYALNNRNQVSGKSGPLAFPEQPYRAVIWTKGTLRDLGDFGLTPNSANAINDRGQATGFAAVLAGGVHDRVAYLYSNGRLESIDNRTAIEPRYSEGLGINNHGHIVGYSDHLQGFVWRGKRMQGLNALVDPKTGWNITDAQAINDAGQIAATAIRNGAQYAIRLDLIRPHGLADPALDADQAAEVAAATAQSSTQAAALARAEVQAQAREIVQPVAQ
ncbi:HAF repeat-containing protein [Massilia sp. CFBP9012]|uniref:HAF repeat-containing protein n=1 Tax=Massilia sp. CFBP9012 TaxID=3096531 RepID=UPI002A6B0B11|nr:HAF repeat-containing protein [Massilia sp. CFBP9012]MDY0978340.1 HAF repeat-containing protein [Massilia sp. CFBP9012]